MSVWLSLFQLPWNSRSPIESLHSALRGAGLDSVCEHGTQALWLSEHVCLCLRSQWQCTLDLLHLSSHNRCIRRQGGRRKRRLSAVTGKKAERFQFATCNALLFGALFSSLMPIDSDADWTHGQRWPCVCACWLFQGVLFTVYLHARTVLTEPGTAPGIVWGGLRKAHSTAHTAGSE